MKTTILLILRQLSILTILFLLSTVMLIAQVRIHERVEIGSKQQSKQQINSDVNTTDASIVTIPIYGKLHYMDIGGLLAIDPVPVYPAQADIGQWQWEVFCLQSGSDSGSGGCIQAHWVVSSGYPIDALKIWPYNHGSGYSPGVYNTNCFGSCCLTVRVTRVATSLDDIRVEIQPEKYTIFAGDTIYLYVQGDYPPELFGYSSMFDFAVGDGTLLDTYGRPTWYLERVWQQSGIYQPTGEEQPIRYIAPWVKPYSGGGVGACSIHKIDSMRNIGKLLAKNSSNAMSMNPGTTIKAQSDHVEIWDCIGCKVNVAFPELVVYPLTGDDNNQFLTETDLPKMPKPVIKAQLQNYHRGVVNFNWTLTITWKTKILDYKTKKLIDFSTPQDQTEIYTGSVFGQNDDIVDLKIGDTLYNQIKMRGGNIISLTVTATTDYAVYETNPTPIINPFVIKGQNPSRETLLAELKGDQYAAIAWHESTFQQFGENDYPKQGGDPCDFGLMQINSPWFYPNDEYGRYYCDDIIWNWVTNIQQGKLMFDRAYERSLHYHTDYSDPSGTAKDAPLDEEEIYDEAYCEYNGGLGRWYWDWKTGNSRYNEPGEWVRSNDVIGNTKEEKDKCITAREYADDVENLRLHHTKLW